MTTSKQDQGFGEKILGEAIDWIKANLAPDQVFDEDELVDWVASNKGPDDVFPNKELEEWAKENDFTKDEE